MSEVFTFYVRSVSLYDFMLVYVVLHKQLVNENNIKVYVRRVVSADLEIPTRSFHLMKSKC